ncbi:MAG: type VI secretion protein IcmF/TssM N-terminal domain-containing protein [Pirellulaceae bacterium]|nr:type VI secretion protein IcmF/TssM N-terminal domain-containing protein [Pirellulaceae bacterium]
MSDATGENEAPEEEEGAEEERLGCLARIIPVTTPGCATLLTVVFLLSTVITVWVIFWLDPNNIPWRHSYSWWRILGILALVVAIPVVVYKTIEIWLEGAPVAYPEVDQAWRAGMQALAVNELSIDSVPIFLITGSSGEAQEKAIMSATGLNFSVEGVPQGPAPIHWYANSEAIYLFCTDASWTSALASLREEMAIEAAVLGINVESPVIRQSTLDLANSFSRSAASVPTSTPVPASMPAATPTPMPVSAPEPNRPSSPGIRGTLELNDFVNPTQPKAPAPIASPAKGSGSFRGTLMLDDANVDAPSPAPVNTPAPVPAVDQSRTSWQASQTRPATMSLTGAVDTLSDRKPILVSHQYSSACLQELQYIGHLVRRARQPLCAINGVLALIQLESIHSSQAELEELQRAIRADLETIRHSFQLKVPVSALVVGLEKERGFRELISRVGRERAMNQRFGRRFDIQAIPARDQMVALATHLCGVFEDWTYTLFREEHALTRPGNTRLYELLSKVRCTWKGRLGDILSGGFGCDTNKREENASVLFSGCYFAATGDAPDRQAFVKGVIEKMGEEQELIEWTQEALSANKRQNIAANLGAIVAIGLTVSLTLMYFLLS